MLGCTARRPGTQDRAPGCAVAAVTVVESATRAVHVNVPSPRAGVDGVRRLADVTDRASGNQLRHIPGSPSADRKTSNLVSLVVTDQRKGASPRPQAPAS